MAKSNRTIAVAITPDVRKVVAERDSYDGQPCCVVCGSPYANPEAHYIPRSRGGLGIAENIVTLCRLCHQQYDQGDGRVRKSIGLKIRAWLMECYPEWDESKLYYRKD